MGLKLFCDGRGEKRLVSPRRAKEARLKRKRKGLEGGFLRMATKRGKVISVRVNEQLYNDFLKTVDKFTDKYTIDFPSRRETRHYTRFPDKPYFGSAKYTLADLLEESMKSFVEKYKTDV